MGFPEWVCWACRLSILHQILRIESPSSLVDLNVGGGGGGWYYKYLNLWIYSGGSCSLLLVIVSVCCKNFFSSVSLYVKQSACLIH